MPKIEPTNGKRRPGRPHLFSSVEELQSKVDEYFENCPDTRKVVQEGVILEVPCPTVTGLALFLGYCDRNSFYDNCEDGSQFSGTLKKARAKMERIYEGLLHGSTPTGAIFALKNFGWVDKKDLAVSGSIDLVEALSGARQRLHEFSRS